MNINQLHNRFKKQAAAGLASALVTNNDPAKDPASRAGDMWQGALASELGADTGGVLGLVLSQLLAKDAEPKTQALAAILGGLGGYAGGGILGHKASKALAANRDKKREALLSKEASESDISSTIGAILGGATGAAAADPAFDKLMAYLWAKKPNVASKIGNFLMSKPKAGLLALRSINPALGALAGGSIGAAGLGLGAKALDKALSKEASAGFGLTVKNLRAKNALRKFLDSAKGTTKDVFNTTTELMKRNPKTTAAFTSLSLIDMLKSLNNKD